MKEKTPQLENGFIRISTEIWEALGHYRLSGEEWLVLNCIFRKTYGWQKKEDRISFGQFSKYTGLARSNVSRAVSKLLSKKIIGVIKNDNSLSNLYYFNKLYKQWTPVIKKDNTHKTVIKNDNIAVIKTTPKVLSKKITTIDTTKNIITKDSKNSLTPCNEEELKEISLSLNVSLDAVKRTHEIIKNKIDANEFKNKTVYHSLKTWIIMGIERGTIKVNPESHYKLIKKV